MARALFDWGGMVPQALHVTAIGRQVNIMKHVRKSLLSTTEGQRNNPVMFDITMETYNRAKLYELIGLFIRFDLEKIFGKNSVGL